MKSRPATRDRPRYARRRAACLAGVYLLFTLHILHWKLSGKTLAPLELNEVMYTLELGIVTAGFIFMGLALLATLIFGRFFCSWGCHILALEDLCAWLLAKLHIRPKPIRSRTLLLVPPTAMIYMFVWPQIARLLDGRPLPILHTRTDGQGWASFMTTDFWRNLPGPWVTFGTFAVCGFAMVYVLGSRAFCAYGCPYGAIFAIADRFAPGRIVASGDCSGCGICTSVCQSRVLVHEEAGTYGRVVNPSCLKDLDCVAACPNGNLRYGFTTPAIFDGLHAGKVRSVPYDFSWPEDLLIGTTLLACLAIFRGLYHTVPFFLTLAMGAIVGYGLVLFLRLFRRSHVRLANLQLKIGPGLTRTGWAYVVVAVFVFGFTVHSAFIRYHQFQGERLCDRALRVEGSLAPETRTTAQSALAHLQTCNDWGVIQSTELHRRKAALHMRIGEYAPAEAELRSVLASFPNDANAVHDLSRVLTELGQTAADSGDLATALARYGEVIRYNPDVAQLHYNIAVLFAAAGQADRAIEEYQRALALNPDDVESLNNLAFLLTDRGDLVAAERMLQQAITIKKEFAPPHFNLGRILLARGQVVEAAAHFRAAEHWDPRYAQAVAELRARTGQISHDPPGSQDASPSTPAAAHP